MKTIKFRGKRIDNKEWVYGYLYELPLPSGDTCMILTQDNNHLDNSLEPKYHLAFTLWVDLFVVDPATVGQFTGLYDKNGKEIYEGDIVKWLQVRSATSNVMEPPEDYIEECMDVVVFGAGAFTVEEAQYPDMAFLCKDYHYNETDLFKWVCNLDDFHGITTDDMYICEVVGNIHDTPDLIEEGGEQ